MSSHPIVLPLLQTGSTAAFSISGADSQFRLTQSGFLPNAQYLALQKILTAHRVRAEVYNSRVVTVPKFQIVELCAAIRRAIPTASFSWHCELIAGAMHDVAFAVHRLGDAWLLELIGSDLVGLRQSIHWLADATADANTLAGATLQRPTHPDTLLLVVNAGLKERVTAWLLSGGARAVAQIAVDQRDQAAPSATRDVMGARLLVRGYGTETLCVAVLAVNSMGAQAITFDHPFLIANHLLERVATRVENISPAVAAQLRAPFSPPANTLPRHIPGIDFPAPNGLSLRPYQRDGVATLYLLQRAILADEMGLGKTAQSILACHASRACRILISAPTLVLDKWAAEIRAWLHPEEMVWIARSGADPIPARARWLLIPHSLLAPPALDWTIQSEPERAAVVAACSTVEAPGDVRAANRLVGFLRGPAVGDSVTLPFAVAVRLELPDARRNRELHRLIEPLQAQIGARLRQTDLDACVFDEFHRFKSPVSALANAGEFLAAKVATVFGLTGTPFRNRISEVRHLCNVVCDSQTDRQHIARDPVAALHQRTVRRLKKDVLVALPPKSRVERQTEVLQSAASLGADKEAAREVLAITEQKTRVFMIGKLLQRLLIEAGQRKANSEAFLEVISRARSNGNSVVVFVKFLEVADEVVARLERAGHTALRFNGMTSKRQRASILRDFAAGRIPILVASLLVAGEAIDLTRAADCVFVDLDWVPAAIAQAEDRLHRHGQTRPVTSTWLIDCGVDGESSIDLGVLSVLRRKTLLNAIVMGEHDDCGTVNIPTRVAEEILASFITAPVREEP